MHIFLDRDSDDGYHWFYDLISGGFWPMSFSSDFLLAVNFKKISSRTRSGLMGLRAGAGYVFDTESSESIDSYLWYGPFAIGSGHTEGILHELNAVLAENSDDASWAVHVGQSAQEAYASSAAFTGSDWDEQGFNYWQYPRVRGQVGFIKVSGSGSDRWSVGGDRGLGDPAFQAQGGIDGMRRKSNWLASSQPEHLHRYASIGSAGFLFSAIAGVPRSPAPAEFGRNKTRIPGYQCEHLPISAY